MDFAQIYREYQDPVMKVIERLERHVRRLWGLKE